MIMGRTIKCYTHIKTDKTPKHLIWRFQICNYFRKMYKFRDFMSTLTIVNRGDFDYLLYIGGKPPPQRLTLAFDFRQS